MDEGLPIAFQVLDEGVPVYGSDGQQVGTVDHVVAAIEQDIFHGLVIRTGQEQRFVAADLVASLHERGVDLKPDASDITALPAPHGGAAVYRDSEPGTKPRPWRHFVDLLEGKRPRDRKWDEEA
jgi:sporulation protein YlmC with PRC-barrel domain